MSFASMTLIAGLVLLTAGLLLLVMGRKSKGTRGTSERPWTERASWRSGIVSMFSGIVSMVASIASLLLTLNPSLTPDAQENDDPASNTGSSLSESTVLQDRGEDVQQAGDQETAPPEVIPGPWDANSRCGRQWDGPEEIVWRVCAGVDADTAFFGLLITNHGSAPVTVSTHLEYARKGDFLPCPEREGKREVTVPAGEELVVGSTQCSVLRENESLAYQGQGWVAGVQDTSVTDRRSPVAHVHPGQDASWDPDIR